MQRSESESGVQSRGDLTSGVNPYAYGAKGCDLEASRREEKEGHDR